MATAKPSKTETTEAPAKKKSKLIIFIGIGVVVLTLMGAGAFFFLNKSSSHEGEGTQEKTHAPSKKAANHNTPPVFYKFEKPFTVKLQTTDQEAYLQTEVQLKLLGPEIQEIIKQYEPELKHRMTLVLMGKASPELMTAQGVQRLANELRDVANDVINPPAKKKPTEPGTEPRATAEPDAMVQSVLFSTFIVQ